jgi:hypothetical protein
MEADLERERELLGPTSEPTGPATQESLPFSFETGKK